MFPHKNVSYKKIIPILLIILILIFFDLNIKAAFAKSNMIKNLTTQINDDYGKFGPFQVGYKTIENPLFWWGPDVKIFYPINQPNPKNVILFCHGFMALKSSYYREFINNMVSNGDVAVIYAPYQVFSNFLIRQLTLWKGLELGVETYEKKLNLDTSKIGVIGHSLGAGFCPKILHRAIIDKGWGSQGSFMYAIQPYFVLGMNKSRWEQIPRSSKILIQVSDNDIYLDHNIAINDIWENLRNHPVDNKEYQVLLSANNSSGSLDANHYMPTTNGLNSTLDCYDKWGVWRRASALIHATFNNDLVANDLVFGHGTATELFMGRWLNNGRPVEGLITMDAPYSLNSDIASTNLSNRPKNYR